MCWPLGHATLCDFLSKHVRNFQASLQCSTYRPGSSGSKLSQSAKGILILKLSFSLDPWPMPGLTSCVLWTGGFLRTFHLLSPESAAPCGLRRASPRSPAPAVLHSDGSDTKEVLGSAKVDHGSDVGQRPSYRSLAYPSFFKARG